MVDLGATHSFISLDVVERLGITVVGTENFGVALGNNEAVHGSAECPAVTACLERSIEVCEKKLPLKLGGSDIILGVQWLEKMEAVAAYWKTQWGGNPCVIKGDATLARTCISLKAMVKTLLG